MRILLEKLFDIREGELFRALSMQLNIFLIITTLLILKPTVNSLFLSTYGVESLPIAFILVAIFAGIFTSIYSRIVRRVRLDYLIMGTLISSVAVLIFFGLALKTGFLISYVLYFFYIWVAIFALLTTSQFWLLANLVFNDREIKRLVGFLGAGAIAGGIFGGYLTSFLTKYINSVELPFVGAVFIGLCIPLTILIWRQGINNPLKSNKKRKAKKAQSHPLKIILQSKHLILLASLVAVGNIVAKLVDYQFSAISSNLISNPEELTAFFGFWFSTFNVVSLLLQLVITRLVITRFGIQVSLLILPVVIALAVILLIIAPELLMAVILLKMADGSLKQSINKSAMELLILPIDMHVKNQTKPFIDVFVDSLATGFAGLTLIFVVKGLALSTLAINLTILAFVVGWVLIALNIRQQYLYSFKAKILQHTQSNEEKSSKNSEKAIVVDGLKKILTEGTKSQIISALKQIRPVKEKRLQAVFLKLLHHPSPEVRVEVLQHLYDQKHKSFYSVIEKMTNDPSDKVKRAALAYLIEHTPLRQSENFIKHLDSDNDRLSGLALISLAIETANNPKMQRKYYLKERIIKKLNTLEDLPESRKKYLNKIYCIQAIGHARISELYIYLIHFFKDENEMVVRQAIHSAGKTKSDYFVRDLIHLLDKPTFSRAAKKALKAYGEQLLAMINKFTKEDPDDLRLIRKYPSIVKRLDSQRAIKFLFKLLEHQDAIVRQEAIQSLSDLREQFPGLRFRKKNVLVQVLKEVLNFQETIGIIHVLKSNPQFNLLSTQRPCSRVIDLLKTELNRTLKNILRLLSLKYSKSNISAIQKGLKSNQLSIRMTTLEFLDNLLDPKLKRILIPLFEVAIVDLEQRSKIHQLNLNLPNEIECFENIIFQRNNLRLKIATLYLIGQLKDKQYITIVKSACRINDPELRLIAQNILAELKEVEEGVYLKKSS